MSKTLHCPKNGRFTRKRKNFWSGRHKKVKTFTELPNLVKTGERSGRVRQKIGDWDLYKNSCIIYKLSRIYLNNDYVYGDSIIYDCVLSFMSVTNPSMSSGLNPQVSFSFLPLLLTITTVLFRFVTNTLSKPKSVCRNLPIQPQNA